MSWRRVSRDRLVSFEGRRYSVPFRWVGRTVEVRGTAHQVACYAEGQEVARRLRVTTRLVVLDQAHFEGGLTRDVLAPTPLGRRAPLQLAALPERRFAGLPAPSTVTRPLEAYVQLLDSAVTRRHR